MKKILTAILICGATLTTASAYQVMSSKELGKNDAKNQNVVVKCTTDTGKVSNQTCSLRRYAKCTGTGTNKNATAGRHGRIYVTPLSNIQTGALRHLHAVAQRDYAKPGI